MHSFYVDTFGVFFCFPHHGHHMHMPIPQPRLARKHHSPQATAPRSRGRLLGTCPSQSSRLPPDAAAGFFFPIKTLSRRRLFPDLDTAVSQPTCMGALGAISTIAPGLHYLNRKEIRHALL